MLESCYTLPSDRYFRMTLIPELFTTLSAKLSDVLALAVGTLHQFHHRLVDDVAVH